MFAVRFCRRRYCRVVTCVCLIHLPCLALPHPPRIACTFLANCISTSLLDKGLGQQEDFRQHFSHIVPQDRQHGVCLYAAHPPLNAHVLTIFSSEPRGLSHILNPSGSGDTQQHVVSGRSFGAYEENGRLYHSWRRGTYPYPTDEVRYAASPVA